MKYGDKRKEFCWQSHSGAFRAVCVQALPPDLGQRGQHSRGTEKATGLTIPKRRGTAHLWPLLVPPGYSLVANPDPKPFPGSLFPSMLLRALHSIRSMDTGLFPTCHVHSGLKSPLLLLSSKLTPICCLSKLCYLAGHVKHIHERCEATSAWPQEQSRCMYLP